MKLADLQAEMTGRWRGTNLLRLSWLPQPEHHSPGTMTVTPVANGKFLLLDYTWEHESLSHQGVLLVGNNTGDDRATASWVDSWHQGTTVLHLTGTVSDDGTVTIQGTYPAPPDPDWGWQITVRLLGGSQLRMEMYNITPSGEADLAVRADYTR